MQDIKMQDITTLTNRVREIWNREPVDYGDDPGLTNQAMMAIRFHNGGFVEYDSPGVRRQLDFDKIAREFVRLYYGVR